MKTYFSYFSNKCICCGYSKEPSHRDGSFEYPKHMFRLVNKNYHINAKNICLSEPLINLHILS